MGSDSRTATATNSKPRPKWRDRHLNQLNKDQLQEVKAHRNDSTVQTAESQFDDTQPLQQQAGPIPASQSARVNTTADTEAVRSPEEANKDKQKSRYAQDRRDQGVERRGDSRSGEASQMRARPSRNRMADSPQSNRSPKYRSPEYRSAGYRSEERGDKPQRRSDRGPVRGSKEARHRQSDDMSAKHSARAPVQPADQESTEQKESGFARLLKFKVSRPVKWGLMAFAIACLLILSFMKPIDNSSQSQLDSALTRAMIGFGLARTLNGVISVAQGTEFAVQPAGVGVNFSPGEILDPVNDLVERFSWVMLLATSSLGVQKILLEVSSWMGISILLGGAGLFFLLTRMRNSAVASMADIAGKLLLLMLLVRFLIPLGSIANDWVYHKFLEPRFEQSSQQLENASDRIREISTRQTQPEKSSGSLTDRAKNLYNSMTSKFDFDGMLNDYKQSAENVSEHAVNLIVVFVLQTVLFPLLFLYLIYRLFKGFLLPSRARG